MHMLGSSAFCCLKSQLEFLTKVAAIEWKISVKRSPDWIILFNKKNQLLKVMSSGEKNPFLTSLFESCGTPDDGLFVDSCDWSFLSFLSVVTSSVSSTALL